MIPPRPMKVFENKLYFIFGIIEGLAILFFVLNLSLFFALRDKIHLWYTLYIALLFLIVMKNDHLDQQFLGLDSELAFRLTPYLSAGAFAIAILIHVVQIFFKHEINKTSIFYRASNFFKLNVVLSAVVHFFTFIFATDYRIHSFVFSWAKLSTLLGILMIIIICAYSFRKGNKGALFIFFGTVVFLIGSVQRLYFPSTLSFLFPPTTFHLSIIVETMVITLGLIFRYWNERNLQRQREAQIVTQTMHDISEEIHDNVGQILTVANLNLRGLHFENEAANNKVDDTKLLIRKAIADLRNLSRALINEETPQQSISKQIEAELLALEKTGFIQTKFSAEGVDNLLESKKLAIIIRIIRETLQNIIKHSKATLVEVAMKTSRNEMHINISDNGIGFDTAAVQSKSNGLQNIRNRCIMLNAHYAIKSSEGQGTQINICIPVPATD
jgi:signal transduction histidine kinase